MLQVVSMSMDYTFGLMLSMKQTHFAVVHQQDALPHASLNAKNRDIWPTLVGGTSVAGSISEPGLLELLLAGPSSATSVSSSGSDHAGSDVSLPASSKRPSSSHSSTMQRVPSRGTSSPPSTGAVSNGSKSSHVALEPSRHQWRRLGLGFSALILCQC